MGRVLGVRQAVEEFFDNSISKEYLYQMIREKQIPHVKLGGRILLDEDELAKWWNEQLKESTVWHGLHKIR